MTVGRPERAVVVVIFDGQRIIARGILEHGEWIGRAPQAKLRVAMLGIGRIHVGVVVDDDNRLHARHSGTQNPAYVDGVPLRRDLPLPEERPCTVDVGALRMTFRPATVDPLLGAAWWLARDALAFAPVLDAPVYRVLRFDERGSATRCAGAVDVVHLTSAAAVRPELLDDDPDGPTLHALIDAGRSARGTFDPALAGAIAHGANDYVADAGELVITFNGVVVCAPSQRQFATAAVAHEVAGLLRALGVAVDVANPRARRAELASFVRSLFADAFARSRAVVEEALVLDATAWAARVPGRPA